MANVLEKVPSVISNAMKNVLFYDATLERNSAPIGQPFDPLLGAVKIFTCKAIAINYTVGAKGVNLEGNSDVNFLILAATLATKPQPLDRISIPKQNILGVIVPQDSPGTPGVLTDPALATWQCRAQT